MSANMVGGTGTGRTISGDKIERALEVDSVALLTSEGNYNLIVVSETRKGRRNGMRRKRNREITGEIGD